MLSQYVSKQSKIMKTSAENSLANKRPAPVTAQFNTKLIS